MFDLNSPSSSPWKAQLQGWLLRTLRHCEDVLEAARRRLVPAPVTLFRDVTAPWLASALCLAARLRLADHLGDEALSVAELGRRVEVHPNGLACLIDVLAAHGYFRLDAQGRVVSTALSGAVRQGVAGSFAELQGRGWYRQAFRSGHVMESWRRQVSPFEVATGQHFFDYLEKHPDAAQLFSAAMDDVTRFCTPFLAAGIQLNKGARVLDVGGGNGELARALAVRFPSSSLAVLDRSLTDPVFAEHPLYRFHQGSFFDPLPKGYDHLLLKSILHDWDDSKCLEILARCRQAVPRGAALTVIECLLPEVGETKIGAGPTFALDWNVRLTLRGQERRASEYRSLFRQSGWRSLRVVATPTPYYLLIATAE